MTTGVIARSLFLILENVDFGKPNYTVFKVITLFVTHHKLPTFSEIKTEKVYVVPSKGGQDAQRDYSYSTACQVTSPWSNKKSAIFDDLGFAGIETHSLQRSRSITLHKNLHIHLKVYALLYRAIRDLKVKQKAELIRKLAELALVSLQQNRYYKPENQLSNLLTNNKSLVIDELFILLDNKLGDHCHD